MAPGSRKFREFPSCGKSGGQAGPASGAGWSLSELDPVLPAVQSAAQSCSALAGDTRVFIVSKTPTGQNLSGCCYCLWEMEPMRPEVGGRVRGLSEASPSEPDQIQGSLIRCKGDQLKYLSPMPSALGGHTARFTTFKLCDFGQVLLSFQDSVSLSVT